MTEPTTAAGWRLLEHHPWFRRLADDGYVDDIHLRTVPRFKTSELSGDEWRVHVRVEFRRKGVLVGYEDYRHIAEALAHLARYAGWGKGIAPASLRMGDKEPDHVADAERMRHTDEDFCAQPGCAEPWTVEYRMSSTGCECCGETTDIATTEWKDYRRRFCDRHAMRGDADLDDADRNYVRIGR